MGEGRAWGRGKQWLWRDAVGRGQRTHKGEAEVLGGSKAGGGRTRAARSPDPRAGPSGPPHTHKSDTPEFATVGGVSLAAKAAPASERHPRPRRPPHSPGQTRNARRLGGLPPPTGSHVAWDETSTNPDDEYLGRWTGRPLVSGAHQAAARLRDSCCQRGLVTEVSSDLPDCLSRLPGGT